MLEGLEIHSEVLIFHYKRLFLTFEKQTPKPSDVELKHSFWDLAKIYKITFYAPR